MDTEDNQVESVVPAEVVETTEVEQLPTNSQVQYTDQNFLDGYNELCTKMGRQLHFNPSFIKRDDGTFSVVVQANIGLLPKNQ
jgi:hypothetical protein